MVAKCGSVCGTPKGLLTELHIDLPEILENSHRLHDVLPVGSVPTNDAGSCGASFKIDAALP